MLEGLLQGAGEPDDEGERRVVENHQGVDDRVEHGIRCGTGTIGQFRELATGLAPRQRRHLLEVSGSVCRIWDHSPQAPVPAAKVGD